MDRLEMIRKALQELNMSDDPDSINKLLPTVDMDYDMLKQSISALTTVKKSTVDIIKQMKFEFEHDIRNGIYGYTQKSMAYNSNKIEGSQLTKEQTYSIFETRQFGGSTEVYRSHDIEELSGHFLMFNYMLQSISLPLSNTLIKNFHKELKQGVFEDRANGYAIGAWKTRPNIVGDSRTVAPMYVDEEMTDLLKWYLSIENVTLKDLLEYHCRFEHIHPFQDGNGRVGRMILYRECLYHNIRPFIIEDRFKVDYIKYVRVSDVSTFEQAVVLWQNNYAAMTQGMY